MSDTPSSDEFIRGMADDGLDIAERETLLQDFAKNLERELSAKEKECAELRKENEALKCGEYICQSCGLRKDSEFEPGDF